MPATGFECRSRWCFTKSRSRTLGRELIKVIRRSLVYSKPSSRFLNPYGKSITEPAEFRESTLFGHTGTVNLDTLVLHQYPEEATSSIRCDGWRSASLQWAAPVALGSNQPLSDQAVMAARA